MSPEDLKEANRLFWIVKGHLIPLSWSEQEIQSVYKSYFARIWGNHEAVYHADGFEQAWQKRTQNESTTKIL